MAEHPDGTIIVDADLQTQKFKAGSDELKKIVNSLNSRMKSLGPTFHKALSGNEAALSDFNAKAAALKDTISGIESKMKALADKPVETDSYKEISANAAKAEAKLDSLLMKQEKLKEIGVKKKSSQWKNLQYDIAQAEEKAYRLRDLADSMKASGKAYISGKETEQYAQMADSLSVAQNQLAKMQSQSTIAAGGIKGLFAAMRYAAPASVQFKTALSGIASGALRTLGIFRSAGGMFRSVGGTIVNVLAHPLKTANQVLGSVGAGLRYIGKQSLKSVGILCKKAFTSAGRAVRSFHKSSIGAGGAIGKLGKKITGLWGMFKRMALRRMLMAVLQSLKAGFDNLAMYSGDVNKDLSALKSGLTQLKNSFATAFAPILSVVTPALVTLMNHIVAVNTQIGKLFAALSGKKTFTKATAVQEDYAKSLNKTGSAAKKAGRQLASFDELNILSDNSSSGGGGGADVSQMFEEVPIESQIIDFVDKIKAALRAGDYVGAGAILADGVNTIFNSVNWDELGFKMGSKVQHALDFLYGAIKTFDFFGLGASVAGFINGSFRAIKWGQLGDTLSSGIIGILTFLRSAIEGIDWYLIGQDVQQFLCGIDWGGVFNALFRVLGAALGGLAAFLWGIIKAEWDSLTVWWRTLAEEDGSYTAEGILKGIWEKVKDIGRWIRDNIFQPFITGFKNAFGIHSPSTVMAELGGYIIDGMFNGIRSRINRLSQAVSEMKDIFSEKKQKWTSVGSNICSGISQGINSSWKWLRDQVKKVANSLLTSAKEALGIHSPSRVFRDTIGLNIGYGVGEGVEKSAPSVLKSVSGVANAIAGEFENGDYKANAVIPTAEIDGSLATFSDKITDSFESLLNRLQIIAENVKFSVPAAATGVLPYKVQSVGTAPNDDLGTVIEASNGELISVLRQVVASAVAAIVAAIVNRGGSPEDIDINAITTEVISDINRRTRMFGASPLLG